MIIKNNNWFDHYLCWPKLFRPKFAKSDRFFAETLCDGTLSDGTLSDGTLSDGTLSDGTLSDGTLKLCLLSAFDGTLFV